MNPSTWLPRLGLGTAALAGLYADVSAASARATVDAAWSTGIRYFDTAPLYGSGLAEERLGKRCPRGRGRSSWSRPRSDACCDADAQAGTSSDAGHSRPCSTTAETVSAAHSQRASSAWNWSGWTSPPSRPRPTHRRGAAFDRRRARGSAPHIGVGTNDVETALAFVEAGEVDVVLLAGRYTLLDRSAETRVAARLRRPWLASDRRWRVQQRRAGRRRDLRLRVCTSGHSETPRRPRSGMCSLCRAARRRGNPVPAQTSRGRIDSRRRPFAGRDPADADPPADAVPDDWWEVLDALTGGPRSCLLCRARVREEAVAHPPRRR